MRRIHFKRLLVDEGHVLAGLNGMRSFSEQVSPCRLPADRGSRLKLCIPLPQLRCECRWAISGTITTHFRGEQDQADESVVASSVEGGDITDLTRFGQLVSGFLRHPAFQSQNWRSIFSTPLLEQKRGAGRFLRLLHAVVVKNSKAELDRAFKLPKLWKEVVMIEMENGAERKMYNALLALFVINSVTSQRKDVSPVSLPAAASLLNPC